MAVTPRERPILFQGAMVRALLAGTKTQTRRAVKPQPEAEHCGEPYWFVGGYRAWRYRGVTDVLRMGGKDLACPYGQPGDRLWVRESWGYFDPDGSGEDYDRDRNDDGKAGPCSAYRAEMLEEGNALRDYWRRRIAYSATWQDKAYGGGVPGPKRWRPSIHMPRWASRITLEITAVRVERLQEISEADAVAEGIGISSTARRSDTCYGIYECRMPDGKTYFNDSAYSLYRELWEQINGAGSWDANPWVWVVEFRRLENSK